MAFQFSKSNLPKQLFINNRYVDSKHYEKLQLYNPKDGSLVADDVPLAADQDVDLAVAAAEAAFPQWKITTPSARRDMMLKLANLIVEHGAALAELTRITLGAPMHVFGEWEIRRTAEAFRYFAGWTDKISGQSFSNEDGFVNIVINEPLGVTAGITPWNVPLLTVGLKAGPALATGNCFILKPSEKTPFACLALGALICEAGFPAGVFQVLSGNGLTGSLLASHMRIRKISFTGSIATGKKIQEAAAKSNLKRITLELGGKSPAVIFDDCNLANAIRWTSQAITTISGQSCFAATRLYVQEGIADRFISGYREAILEITRNIGDPDSTSTQMGPLVDSSQHKRVVGFIDLGKNTHGGLLTGGQRLGDKGFFVEPAIFLDVPEDAHIMREEIFGPVVIINTFKTEAEVMQKANDSEFGLMAGVFSQDINRALRCASNFESGMVGINCVSLMFLTAPLGGMKQSGQGRECGEAGWRSFVEPKTIMINMSY
ncbi:uncharacterized protein Z520_10247 [Fonsecaea multimorphosa CBS 102226]|uniref:aldehyde dehydrogenase (NAD(+)) n=1 Tax=Fonsecaea multimorphosa CBS 102226 TaxID=1442371 RepID=A0A0D2GWF2_9EURO|nr:uncharacterized protein Z520_10247 [Fonsecaea multimorphosa CBS 102226]KIX93910.1 hypothetical protein Z520_10247 [Fonsecaea multimorphosa CBS 102226]OAL19263.1 hypothetical protein AYO22_09807 [Fonsecaea multimorphosa]